jgi:hypothetical protein
VQDADPSSHVISVSVTTDAGSEKKLGEIVADHRIVDDGEWNRILLIQVVSVT